jgi:MFS family permease
MLAATALYKAIILTLLATLAWNGANHMWLVFVLIALSGIGQSFEIPATQGLITDIVPPRLAMKAVAMQSTGARAVGALGSLGGGLAIAAFGVPLTLYAGAGVFLIGAAAVATMPLFAAARGDSGGINTGIFLQAAKGLLALIGLPLVRMLLLTACSVEMFAFAYIAVLPSIARDVLHVGADGLGTLTLMAGLGSVIGAAILTIFGYSSRKGMLLIGVTITFGLTLIAFASSWILVLSLFLIMGVGAMAAVFDALQWTLLQQYVPGDMRGRAIGGWVFVVGFGWIGQLALGGVAQVIGVQWALVGAGALVMLTGLAAYGLSPRLRVA